MSSLKPQNQTTKAIYLTITSLANRGNKGASEPVGVSNEPQCRTLRFSLSDLTQFHLFYI